MSSDWSVGDLVWAKMKSYPWWPSVIAKPRDEVKKPITKKPMHFVEFFGSNNYAWIPDEFIHPFEKYKSEHSGCSLASFKAALSEINEYISSSVMNGKISKMKDDSPKSNSIVGKKRPLKINHSPVKSSKITPPKDAKTALKPRKLTSTPVHTTKKSTKRRLSESSNTSVDGKVNNLDSSLTSDIQSIWDGSSSFHESYTVHKPQLSCKKSLCIEKSPIRQRLDDSLSQPSNSEHSCMNIGFIGLGNMGANIVKSLICAGHNVTVWTKSHHHSTPFREAGIRVGKNPQDVVSTCDITFSCVANPQVAKEVVFGHNGILKGIGTGKSYIEITSIDPETSRDIAEAISKKEGIYLEAPVIGTKELAMEGRLLILAAGDGKLFERCKPCFQAMGEHAFYLGEVGNAAKMNLIISMMMGTTLACLAEALSLAKRVDLTQMNLLEIIALCPLGCPLFQQKGEAMLSKEYVHPDMRLSHLQKDMQLALQLGDRHIQALPTAAAANEVFKLAKNLGCGSRDVAAVYSAN